MKQILPILIILFSSCVTYTYKLVEPIESNSLSMENDTMKISFSMAPKKVKKINFHLENKLNTPMKVIWDDASVSVMGRAFMYIVCTIVIDFLKIGATSKFLNQILRF